MHILRYILQMNTQLQRIAFAVGLALLAWGLPLGVRAEDESAATFFRRDLELQLKQRKLIQRPTHLVRRAAPVRGFTTEAPAEGTPAPVDPNAVPVEQGATEQAATPPVDARPTDSHARILVLGDSFAQDLARGLTESFADRQDIALVPYARESATLMREDGTDVAALAREVLARKDHIDFAIVMVGTNDRQPLREPLARDAKTDRRAVYGDRIEALIKVFGEQHIPVLWVGLPIMKGERLSADINVMNGIFRDRVASAGGTYIDLWEAFQDDRGQYSSYGPDVNGQFQKLRTNDGIRFTRAGARKLAYFVEGDIRRLLEKNRTNPDPVAALEPPKSALGVTAPVPEGPTRGALNVPLPAPLPAVVIPVKPVAGPVVPLTTPAVSSGGVLVTSLRASRTGPGKTEADALIDRTLVQGRSVEPRPGRTDDFIWPRR